MRKIIVTVSTIVASVVLLGTASADENYNCRAFDGDGSVISEANASSAMDCSRRMFVAVKEARCDDKSNQGKSYRYSIQAPKTNRRTPQSIFCATKR